MPRLGGEADKLGNRYEGLWSVDAALDLIDGEYAGLTVEAVGDEAAGVEFVRTAPSGVREYHSIKRQQGAGNWTLSRLTNLESTDRSLKGRAAGLPERSAGVPAFAGRCRSEEPSLSVAQRGSGALRAPARGCARRARACWREPRTRVGAVSERQAGSGNARNRARAVAHWPAQGQRFARCRVQRRAEWVSRPARAK